MKKSTRKTNDRRTSSARRHTAQPQQQQTAKSGQPQQKTEKGGEAQQYGASGEGKQYGEGSYSGTRQYNAGLKEHLQTHDIEREARDAAPRSADEAKEMNEAERIGRSRAKGTPSAKRRG